MNKGVTPHNYNQRSRFGPELLRPSDFTPPTYTSTPKATAPQPSNDLPVTPTRCCNSIYIASNYISTTNFAFDNPDLRYQHNNHA
ncbi:hypothetical protein ACJMK2_013350 [Sinanodonta woodiana]|uniref:Uncharacterized protein n=1 Tax=Sinanodonta woodiana TaxID=1069815 RepID=A0ABD3UX81_SINWO